jgi:hypothetical protein
MESIPPSTANTALDMAINTEKSNMVEIKAELVSQVL